MLNALVVPHPSPHTNQEKKLSWVWPAHFSLRSGGTWPSVSSVVQAAFNQNKWFLSHRVDYVSKVFSLPEVRTQLRKIKYGKINMVKYF